MGSMDIFSSSKPVTLDLRHGPAEGLFLAIGNRGRPARTAYRLTFEPGTLRIAIEADDPDMLNLVATVSAPDTDTQLYEEDCVQAALALSGQANPAGMLLINARGSRRGFGTGQSWGASVARHAAGWRLDLEMALPAGLETIGLGLHRFFRGISGGVSGLAPHLPHPLEPARFACLVLGGSETAGAAAELFRAGALQAAEEETDRTVQALRARLAAARAAGMPASFMPLADDLTARRLTVAVKPDPRFLCWNEGHFQHALLDLWEITRDRTWLDRLVPRIQEVWSLTGQARQVKDALWQRELPTWYNDLETGAACTLVSGVILWPIARLIRIILDTPDLRNLRETALAWIPKIRAILDFHDPEWVDFPDGSGMHLEPYEKGPRRPYPRGGSRINPLNREFFLSLPMLELARITGEPEYRRKVEANARFFRNTSDITDSHFQWEYLVAACPADGEDLSHATCQVAFAERCVEEGLVFTETDLRKIARTLAEIVFRHGDVPTETIRGHGPCLNVAVGVWSSLCRYEPDVFPKICAVVATAIHEQNPLFSGREGWGIRVLTSLEKARKRL